MGFGVSTVSFGLMELAYKNREDNGQNPEWDGTTVEWRKNLFRCTPFKLILLTLCLFASVNCVGPGTMGSVLLTCFFFTAMASPVYLLVQIGEVTTGAKKGLPFFDTCYEKVAVWYSKFVDSEDDDGRRRLESMDLESTGTDHQKMFLIASVLVLFSLAVAAHLAYRARSKRSSIYKRDGVTIRV